MKNIYLFIFSALLFSGALKAELIVFENWQGGQNDQNIHDYNGWVGINKADGSYWAGPQSNDARIIDLGDGNLLARYKAPAWQSRGFRKSLGGLSLPEGQTGTFFFRIMAPSVSVLNHRVALTSKDAPQSTGDQNVYDDVVSVLFAGQDATHYRISGMNGGSFVSLKTDLLANVWYYIWLVVNQSSDTYDVYLTDGSIPVQNNKIGTGLTFRASTSETLDVFYTWAGKMGSTASAFVFIDDICVDPSGVSLYHLDPLSPDINADEFIDMDDLLKLAENWLHVCIVPDWCQQTDLNKSGRVDLADFESLSKTWLESVTPGLVGWWKLDDGSGLTAHNMFGNNHGTLLNTEANDWNALGDGYAVGLDAQTDDTLPQVYWPMNDTAGTSVTELMNGFNGIVKNSSGVWAAGKINNSLILDGVDDYVEISSYSGVTGTASRTCSAWIKTGNLGFNNIIASWGYPAAGQQIVFGLISTGQLALSTGYGLLKSSVLLTDDQWHHVAFTLTDDGSPNLNEGRLYIDGQLQTDATAFSEAVNTTSSGKVYLGVYQASISTMNGYFKGALDDIRIYNAAFTDTQIQKIAQNLNEATGECIELPRLVQDNFSIAFWLRTTNSADDGDQWWYGKGLIDADADGVQNDFGISLTGNVAAFGVGRQGGADVTIKSAKAINDGYWHHIAATRDAATGQMQLYIDGVSEASGTGSTGSKNAQSRLLVGSLNYKPGKYLTGQFDEIRIFNRVLPTADIIKLATKKFPALTPKKGQAGTTQSDNKLKVGWFYNWGRNAAAPDGVEFVPMQWGKWWPGLSTLVSELTAMKQKGTANYLLGLNEPDSSSQADTTVSKAIEIWGTMMQTGLPLGSPATVHADNQWMQDFMTQAAALNYPVDFVAIHWYGGNSASSLMSHLQSIYNLYGRPIWITEFAVADWNASSTSPNQYTPQQIYTTLAEMLWRLETTSYLKRYAWFSASPSTITALGPSALFEDDGSLTELGRLYAAWDGDVDGPDENTWYLLHHQSSNKRLRTPDGIAVQAADIIANTGIKVEWKLISAGGGFYYIQNNEYGKRLSASTSGAVSLVSNTETGDTVQWKLVGSSYGWYFIDHKATGKRLHYRNDWGYISLVDATYTDSNVKWRFIKSLQ